MDGWERVGKERERRTRREREERERGEERWKGREGEARGTAKECGALAAPHDGRRHRSLAPPMPRGIGILGNCLSLLLSSMSTAAVEESTAEASPHSKPCTLCHKPRDVLIRCQIDSSEAWHFICPGACWKRVSGGVVDGDGSNDWYRYGGMWKNKKDAVSAKMKKGKGGKKGTTSSGEVAGWVVDKKYTPNDLARWDDRRWVCRKSHWSEEGKEPSDKTYGFWKEEDTVED